MGETTAARRLSGKCPSVGGRRRLSEYIGGPLFVPGEATTRDKRTFCPVWWLHPGQKGGLLSRVNPPPGTKAPFVPGGGLTRDKRPPHITSSFALPLTLGFSSICAWCRRRPLLPPPREPSTAAAIDVAAAQSPDLTPPPRAPTNPPETRRNTAAAVTPSPAPPSPARRRPAATGHPNPRRDYPKVELDLLVLTCTNLRGIWELCRI